MEIFSGHPEALNASYLHMIACGQFASKEESQDLFRSRRKHSKQMITSVTGLVFDGLQWISAFYKTICNCY